MSFTGKTVIVTGATSGIGRSTAEAFGHEGASLVLVGRDAAVLAEVAALAGPGGRAVPCAVDVTADEAPQRIVAAAVDHFGGIDVLVNAAGIIATGTLDATTDQMW